jgi:signal transduction histidine kinase
LFAWTVYQRVAAPAAKVVEGAKRLADGDLSHRIDLKTQDEFGSIASTLDTMASRLSDRTAAMTAKNESLDTALGERNHQLEQLLAQARELEGQRKRLLADVSHELRTPLTIIRGEADVVLRGSGDRPTEEYREALSRIRDAVGHSARIVDDLLTAARSEQGELRLRPKQFDLRDLLESTSDTFAGGVSISGEAGPASVRADPDRLRQALLVLMNNARHHGGRLVDIRLHRTPLGWRIDVEDDGRGLSEEDKKQAFERFFRGSNAAENYSEGLGLGLPIARMIARAHGGDITLHDREEGGTSARLDLPAQPMLRAAAS